MGFLERSLRRQLKRVVVDARDVAEAGARAALEALAVHHRESYGHMSVEQQALRRRLRAHGRQLGDRRDARGAQAIERLVRECAYEHWHRMLFARFLAENRLLIEPEHGVAVTLEDCESLGKDAGFDKWAMAGRFAHQMLPQVFRPGHPAFELRLAREHRLRLEGLAEGLPDTLFAATDSLGWVYQFWQSRRKAEVNRSEVKIGADELPAVTQLFTEPYMVSFLLDNALGAWWAERCLDDSDLLEADTEAILRRKAGIPGVPLDFLRFVRSEDAPGGAAERAGWCPATGAFNHWPEQLGELRVIDPCCGSGHFLVAALLMLVPMRMALEGLAARDAVDAVLRDNLHGVELDSRCVELAAFALALAAWTYPGAKGYRPLPELNLACSGLSVGVAKERWTELAAGRKNLRIALDWMYGAFADAPVLGSLLNPATADAAKLVDWGHLSTALARALQREQSDGRRETMIAAQGLAKAADLLAGRYHWVVTNVPYLNRGRQGEVLRRYCESHYPAAKNELATVFLERCLELCTEGGTASLVLPQNWLSLIRYEKLRKKLLKSETWQFLARLGPRAFETITGDVVKPILFVLRRRRPANRPDRLLDEETPASVLYQLDVSAARTATEKAALLPEERIRGAEQAQQLENPDSRVALDDISTQASLDRYCTSVEGLTTGDLKRFVGKFWEGTFSGGWEPYIQNVASTEHFGARSDRILWENGDGVLSRTPTAHNFPAEIMNGKRVLGRLGLRITQMGDLPVTTYTGEVFGKSGATVVPDDPMHLPAIWCFCSSAEYHEAVRRLDQKLNVTNATLAKVPFELDRWTRVVGERYPNGLPGPYSDDPTQWIFHGHPCGSVVWDKEDKWTADGPLRTDPTVLQVAVARLLGYRWPAEHDADMELADEQREWVRRCGSLNSQADTDGIVCIPAVRGEESAGERLRGLLISSYGGAWCNPVLSKLLAELGSQSLDDWLRDHFFDQHRMLFHQRPFIWHIWDGRRRDGFHALVNYHRLAEGDGKGRRLLESLTYSYLGDWITRQQDGVERREGGAEDRLVAALELKRRLVAILEGEPPFDIFVRWKPIEQQAIGWEPDINDGLRMNIRPFVADDISGGKKSAGILRSKPNLNWRKDPGKEPGRDQIRFPWFWDDGRFAGVRVNDVHLSHAEKQTARARKKGGQP